MSYKYLEKLFTEQNEQRHTSAVVRGIWEPLAQPAMLPTKPLLFWNPEGKREEHTVDIFGLWDRSWAQDIQRVAKERERARNFKEGCAQQKQVEAMSQRDVFLSISESECLDMIK